MPRCCLPAAQQGSATRRSALAPALPPRNPRRRASAAAGAKKEWRNPFLPYERALWVADLGGGWAAGCSSRSAHLDLACLKAGREDRWAGWDSTAPAYVLLLMALPCLPCTAAHLLLS